MGLGQAMTEIVGLRMFINHLVMKTRKESSGRVLKVLTAIVLTGLLTTQFLSAQGWYDGNWLYRSPVTVSNPEGTVLSDFQVKITLTGGTLGNFDFAKARSDGRDILLTSGDGTTLIPFWIESWVPSTSATIWVKVPSVPASPATTSVFLYYGNSSATSIANGNTTFEFFDDFESPSTIPGGYFSLSNTGTQILGDHQAWESSPPHTFDVVDWNHDGYRYWGYYGLQAYPGGGPVGLARSNDLETWTKYDDLGTIPVGDPVINVTNARWPSVLFVDGTLHIFYTDYTDPASSIVRETSVDGITFTSSKSLVVSSEPGIYNGSPDLFIGPDGTYYLYWVRITGSEHQIMARSASTIEGLSSATNVTVMTSATTLAAPDMMYRNGKYYLTCEVYPSSVWETYAYESTSPTSGFTPVTGNPILGDGIACYSQHVIGTTLHAYYAKLTGSTWTMEYRNADVTQGLPQIEVPDITKWTSAGGSWNIETASQQNGISGNVIQGITSGFQTLYSVFPGTDYILEGCGYQIGGNEWGLGFRVADPSNYFTFLLYQNINELYLYNWVAGAPSAIAHVDAGTIDLNTWYKMTVKAHGNNFDAYINDSPIITNATSPAHSSGGVALFGESGTNAYFNDIRVRKYAASEPSASVGAMQNQLPVLNISVLEKVDLLCNGASDGLIEIAVTDGTPPYSYLWIPGGQTSARISGLTAGTYSVHVEDASGRLGNVTVIITQPAALLPAYIITSPVDCSTGNATVLISATGGIPGYTGTGSFQQSVGTKIYQVRDANNCTADISVTVNPPGSWLDPAWPYRKPIIVSNTGSTTLTGFQVKLTLTGGQEGNFDFAKSLSTNGNDIRITDGDGTTLLPYWIESWSPPSATIWVRVPSIAANTASAMIYLYYGKSSETSFANGNTTFDFFDDFEKPSITSGYYTLSSPGTTILVRDQLWETSSPHTLDIVDWLHDGYRYWGYYCLEGGGGGPVGLARTNDLNGTWTKYGPPVIDVPDARWASVKYLDNVLHIFYTKTSGGVSIVRDQSLDGITFTGAPTTVVPAEPGYYNGSPDLFIKDGIYYLYWVRINNSTGVHDIMARTASSLAALASAPNITVLSTPAVLAAPDMMYNDGKYFLACEALGPGWITNVYVSESPVSGFVLCSGNPVLGDGSACYSQHLLGNALHLYYAKLTGTTWTMEHRSANPAQPLPVTYLPDVTKWTSSGGSWNIAATTQKNGASGNVVQGVTTAFQILRSAFTGNDYVLEADGYQVSGPEWGLGFRVSNNLNYYTTNLYHGIDEMYLYNWVNGGAVAVTHPPAGSINPATWYTMTVKAHGNYFDGYINNNQIISNASNSDHPNGSVALFGESGTNAYFNDLRVRKYAAIEPTAFVGTEQSPGQWTGAVNSDWNIPGNWSAGVVPDNCSNITISAGTTPHITTTSSAKCNDLTILSGLTIDAGGALTVNHNLTNSGTLTINSSGTASSGSLIVNGSSTGAITYNRQLNIYSTEPPYSNYDWHYFSSPVGSNTASNSEKITAVYSYDEPTDSWSTTSITSLTSGKGYNLDQTSSSDGLISFTGFVINAAGPIPATSPYSDCSFPGGIYTSRTFASGRNNTTLYGGGGWNLLGNPFTSALNATTFISGNVNNFDPNYQAVYIYNGNVGTNGTYYYIGTDMPGWENASGSFGSNNVQVGQGFFVLAHCNTSSFAFTPGMQIHDVAVVMTKSAKAGNDPWPGLQLKVKYGDKENSTLVVYNENMSVGLDPGYDVGQLSASPDLEIYTALVEKDNSVNFARQALPKTDYDKNIIQVGIDTEKGGEVTFSAFTVPIENHKFWLEDRVTGTYTDLTSGTYMVTLPARTYGTGRFFIITSANTPTGKEKPQAENTDIRIWTSNDKVIIKGEVGERTICEIYNLRGQKIIETHLADGEMNMVSLPTGLKGVYLVRVIDGQKVTTKKVAIL